MLAAEGSMTQNVLDISPQFCLGVFYFVLVFF